MAWTVDNSRPTPSQAALRRQLNAIKCDQFPWMLEVTKNAAQMTFIPNLGWVRLPEALRFSAKIISATIYRLADRCDVDTAVDTPDSSHLPNAENHGVVGADLGVSALAALPTGETVPRPKPHQALLDRLRNLSRTVSGPGQANRRKARTALAKLHTRIATIRSDGLHKLTTDLTRWFHSIGIEDLNLRAMVRNRHLARSVADMGFLEFRRQLEYKAAMRGGRVEVATATTPAAKRARRAGTSWMICRSRYASGRDRCASRSTTMT
ncbi:RNA-guided endonuclease InsQ/TnpB family protein [Burkholderia sp. MR1-5-21]